MLISVPIRFRLCTREDLPALEWMGLHTLQRAIITEAFEAQERGDMAMILALTNDFPVAQGWLDFAERGTPDCPRLWAVRVFPPLQNASIGTHLMAEAERHVRARGGTAIEVGVERDNAAGQRFYERLGYRVTGTEREEVEYEFDGTPLAMVVDQLLLRKELVIQDPATPATPERSEQI